MSELPQGWVETVIGELTQIETGSTPPTTQAEYYGGEIPFFKPGDLEQGRELVSAENTLSEVGSQVARIIPSRSLLVTCIGNLGKSGLTTKPSSINQQINAILPSDALFPEFAYYWSRTIGEWLYQHASATTITIINRGRFAKAPIRLPPFPEQCRITSRLDSLLSRTNAARNELARIPLLIEHYKQAILEKAFSGDLTKNWRENYGLPPADQVTVGSLVNQIKYGTARKCYSNASGVAVLRIPNIAAGRIHLTDLKYAALDERELARLALAEGDILVVRSNGSADLVGRPALVTNSEAGLAYAGYLIRLRPNQELVYPKFLKMMLETPQVRSIIEINARSTSGVHNINSAELAALRVPNPTVEEQHEIVHRIEAAMDWLNIVATEQGRTAHLLDHLDESLLAKAIRGQLVLQNPNDEPAEKLLERIRAVPSAEPKSRRGRRSRAAA